MSIGPYGFLVLMAGLIFFVLFAGLVWLTIQVVGGESLVTQILNQWDRFGLWRPGRESGSRNNYDHIDDQINLEQIYQDLQSNLIQVRQAVAQAIATEKQLEQQLQKSIDQAETWQNRAAMAVQQNNDELAKQALQRRQQYVQAANDLEHQLGAQKGATSALRQRLTDLEAQVQKAYTKKQILMARQRAAKAVFSAKEALNEVNTKVAFEKLAEIEKRVQELERKADLAYASEEAGTKVLEIMQETNRMIDQAFIDIDLVLKDDRVARYKKASEPSSEPGGASDADTFD